MSRAQLVALGRLARPDQIAQCFMGCIGYPYCGQIPATVAPRQSLGIASIGLDPIARFHRHQGRGHHLHLTNLLTAAGWFGMTPTLLTAPSGLATATAIVCAWTSNPTNRTVFIAGSRSYVALRHGSFPIRSVIHEASRNG